MQQASHSPHAKKGIAMSFRKTQPSLDEKFHAAMHYFRSACGFRPALAIHLTAEIHVFKGLPVEYLRATWERDVPSIIRDCVNWEMLAQKEIEAGRLEAFEMAGERWVADVNDLFS
jgi:hypothetical protein